MATKNEVNSNLVSNNNPVSKYSGPQSLTGPALGAMPPYAIPPPRTEDKNDNSIRSQGIENALQQLSAMYRMQKMIVESLQIRQQQVIEEQEKLFIIQEELNALTQLLQVLTNSETTDPTVPLIVAVILKGSKDQEKLVQASYYSHAVQYLIT